MHTIIIRAYSLFVLFSCIGICHAKVELKKQTHKTFDELYNATQKNLKPKIKGGQLGQTILNTQEFKEVLNAYFDHINQESSDLKNTELWIDSTTPQKLFQTSLKTFYSYNFDTYEPFVAKRVLPVDSRVAIHGDLHGGFFELLEFIKYHLQKGDINNDFTIASKNFYLLFLGDYTDRGIYGAEVIYTLLRLKLANPEQVMIVRGNHEDHQVSSKFGFLEECKAKFPNKVEGVFNRVYSLFSYDDIPEIYRAIHYLYETFPVALYIGSGTNNKNYFAQANHGGLEIGFNPKPLLSDSRPHLNVLLTELRQLDGLKKLSEDLQKQIDENLFKNSALKNYKNPLFGIGFLWNDFFVDESSIHEYKEGRGHKFGKQVTHEILTHHASSEDGYDIPIILRAHQHGDMEMMKSIHAGKGISRLWPQKNDDPIKGMWEKMVCTFTVAPDAGYAIKYDAFGIFTFGPTFAKSSLEVFQIMGNTLYAQKLIKPKKEQIKLTFGQTLNNDLVQKLFDFNTSGGFDINEYVAAHNDSGNYVLGKVENPLYQIIQDESIVQVKYNEQTSNGTIFAPDKELGKLKENYELVIE